MAVSVILAHPDTESFSSSISCAVSEQLRINGHSVAYHDLYQERFDPLLPATEIPSNAALPDVIRTHCEEIAEAEGIVVIHPNWWGQPPAILKGWIDRVIRPGVAYEFLDGDSGEGVPRGLLKAAAAVVFNTSNTAHEREELVFEDPLETLWRNCIFGLCGVHKVERRTFSVVVTSTLEQRLAWLQQARDTIDACFPKSP